MSLGVCLPLIASLTPGKVQGTALYGIDVRIAIESSLNRLQSAWAKNLLGIGTCPQGAWNIVRADCGWCRRLGTTMLERALALSIRVQLLPLDHPALIAFQIASASEIASWASQLREIQWRLSSFGPLPPITDILSDAEIDEARSSATAGKWCEDLP